MRPFRNAQPRRRLSNSGFTLIEILVVLALVSLLLGALLGPVSLRLEAEQRSRAADYLETIREAVFGFAMRNGRLPCPDSSGSDGLENPPGAFICPAVNPTTLPVQPGCDNSNALPWATLGVPRQDGDGRRVAYRVSNVAARASTELTACTDYQNSNQAGRDLMLTQVLSLRATGTLEVRGRNPNKSDFVLAQGLALVLVHPGASDASAAVTGRDENRNTSAGPFFSRPPNRVDQVCSDTAATLPSCHFDDLIEYIPTTVLQYHLVNAGRLPP